MLPLFLDLHGKRVVVFGGGDVGHRKACFFAKEANVTVISRSFCPALQSSEIMLVEEDALDKLSHWVSSADLVVAATDSPDINRTIETECVKQGKWCNNAHGVSNFLIPSMVEREGYTVSLSTMGRSPAMSKFIKLKLEEALPPEYSAMIALQEDIRSKAKQFIRDQPAREKFLWDILRDEEAWELVRSGNVQKAKELAIARMVHIDGKDP
jgi:precorrin-2 dehydrogenase / sirohydrochlorin ferrochelatase